MVTISLVIDARREILTQVAQGILSPQEGAARLEELERPLAEETAATTPPPAALAAGEGPAGGLRITVQAGRAEIVGDLSVREAVVEGGPHSVTREGRTMVISMDPPADPGYFFSRRAGRMAVGLGDLRTLRIRVNPEFAIELESQAAAVDCRGIKGPIRASAQASTTRIEDCEGPLNVTCQAGSVKIRSRLVRGDSTIRSDAGSVQVDLLRGSSVRLTAAATMGKVTIDGASPTPGGWGLGRAGHQVVVGDGAASLAIDTTMGAVRVTTGL